MFYSAGVGLPQLMPSRQWTGKMDGDGGGRFHTQTECISRIIKFDSKQKKKTKLVAAIWYT
jgi:hypothetical protein